MNNLKNKIQEYKEKYGKEMRGYKGFRILYNWEFNLMRDLKAISVRNEGDPYGVIIRVVFPTYMLYKEKREEIRLQERRQQYAIKMNTPPDLVDVSTFNF